MDWGTSYHWGAMLGFKTTDVSPFGEGFLPLMNINKNAMRAQIEVGCREFERHFGKRPQGIWLAECGYAEGVDEILKECGIRYFFVDTHGVLFAEPRPKYGVYAPIMCPKSGVACMARDTESSKQVWSAIEGYPGDYNYREFYRDIGFDLDYEYIKPHLHQTGIRSNTASVHQKQPPPNNTRSTFLPFSGALSLSFVVSAAAAAVESALGSACVAGSWADATGARPRVTTIPRETARRRRGMSKAPRSAATGYQIRPLIV